MDHVSSERSRSQTDEKALSLAVEVKLLLVQSCQFMEQSPPVNAFKEGWQSTGRTTATHWIQKTSYI